MKKLCKVLIAVSMPLIMLLMIVFCVEAFSGDRAWLGREYDKLDINWYTGMSTDDQIRAFMQMVDYMKGDADSMDVTVTVNGEEMPMYNEREISHMHDVRALYKKIMLAKWCVIGFAVLTAVLSLIAFKGKAGKRELLRFTAKAAVIAFACILLFVLAIGLWAIIDFDSFWAEFHVIFLDLESSTFDPAVSRMIRICPAELFSDMVLRIFGTGLAVSAAIAAAGAAYLIVSKKKRHNEASSI
ncbi:MAG: DUF1461 domain-containing protein [Clostridia bacterium]|nr:DUF1461 domain-containing protein [Clostridia bacterium]